MVGRWDRHVLGFESYLLRWRRPRYLPPRLRPFYRLRLRLGFPYVVVEMVDAGAEFLFGGWVGLGGMMC